MVTLPGLLIVRLWKVVIALLLKVDADDPTKRTLPLLCVKAALFVKFPDKSKLPEVDVKVPALIVSAFKVTAWLTNANVPAPAFDKLLVF